jgi:hypothetical protein
VSMTNRIPLVSGPARGAASVRPSAPAPRPWMSEAGFCPAAGWLRSRSGITASAVLLDEHSDGRVDGRKFTHEFNRQSTYEPGSSDLIPPV